MVQDVYFAVLFPPLFSSTVVADTVLRTRVLERVQVIEPLHLVF